MRIKGTAGQASGFRALAMLTAVGLTGNALAQGGDTPTTAVPIAVPGSASGTTVGFTNTSDETCPYAGSTSPDVWYTFTATSPLVNVSLCATPNPSYDSKVYVYDENLELATTISGAPACDDDTCLFGRKALAAFVLVDPGEDYFIVVDGWEGDAGPYVLEVTDDPCVHWNQFQCPTAVVGGAPEGEPCTYGQTSIDDRYNGGCGCSQPDGCFQELGFGVTLAGRTHTDGFVDDEDWFTIDVSAYPAWKSFVVEIDSEFRGYLFQRDDEAGCDGAIDRAVRFEGCGMPQAIPVQRFGPELWIGVAPDPPDAPDMPTQIDCDAPNNGTCPFTGADYTITVRLDPQACPDLDGSGGLDMVDLLLILSNWGPCPPVCPFDLDGDGQVSFTDLLTVLAAWGPCPTER